MAGETILARVRDQEKPVPGVALVGWVLSAPIIGADGIPYQAGSDLIPFSIMGDSQNTQKSLREGIAARVTEVTGQQFTAADVRGFQAVRTGNVTVAGEASKDVVFSTPMPSATYTVIPSARGLVVGLDVINKSKTGFTLTLASSVAGTISYIVVED